MSSAPPSSASRWSYFALRLVLIAVVVGTLVFVNRQYFFHAQAYDEGDQAANSLSILRAEQGQELLGNYSRWGFHHPGPAVFYGEGAAELTLYRWLHVVPTPLNAQILFIALLMTSLLAVGLSVAARWVRSPLFLLLALTFAVLHLTGANASTLLLNNWPPYVIPMALFALMILTASVAAGAGMDLPMLVFTGCLLLHMHVAQPLFVGPMFVLAYLGLAWSCWQQRRAVRAAASVAAVSPEGAALPPPVPSGVPWRVYRGAHGWALLIAALFALPLLVDLTYKRHSNFFLILEHLRSHRGERHPYLASVDYLLRFAVYQPSLPNAPVMLAAPAADPHELTQFALRHGRILLLWVAALLSPLLAWAVRVVVRRRALPIAGDAGPALPAGRWRFLGILFLIWFLSMGLTVFWGHIQDGPMYYFNAWFDYAIWFVLALLGAASLADALETILSRASRPAPWRGGINGFCMMLAVGTLYRHADQFVLRADEGIRAYTRTALATLAHEPAGTPRAKLLLFPEGALGAAMSLAETLTRADRPVYVLPMWEFVFGRNHVLKDWRAYAAGMPADARAPLEVWRIVPPVLASAAGVQGEPLVAYTLVRGSLPVDPATGFAITCAGPAPNSVGYVSNGWSKPDNGEPAWTDDRIAWMQFHALPVPAGSNVTLTFDFKPFLVPGKCDSQRIKLSFNGTDLGTLRATDTSGTPNQFVVPGGVWNKSPSALVVMEFPDAMSPKDATGSPDDRPLAFLISSLKFTTTAPADAPATP